MTTSVNSPSSLLQNAITTVNTPNGSESSSGGSTAGATGPTSNATLGGLATNFQDFLQLLTTQMTNQDPLQPMDSTQFTAQLVQFTEVEASINTNTDLSQLIGVQQGSEMVSALNLVGQTVTASGNQVNLANGTAQIQYSLPSTAASATVVVKDSSGNLVATLQGGTQEGLNTLTWNGQTSSGGTAPAGVYTIAVTATDGTGAPVTATTGTSGTVTGVETQNNQVNVMIGSIAVPLQNVTSVGTTD